MTWQPADPDEDAQVTQNVDYRWSIGEKNAWNWDRVNSWLDPGNVDREWEFDEPGETVLRIAVREDAAKLDAIFVTSNVDAVAAGQTNVRLPTDEDRELQEEGLSVDVKDKVTTTWGSLKQKYR